METNRTLSRPTLTVQDMTVDSALKPTLPLVDTPRCDLRPSPGTAFLPTKRRERFSCTGTIARLTVLWSLVRTSIPDRSRNVKCFGLASGFSACGRRAFHPPFGKQGAFKPVLCNSRGQQSSPRPMAMSRASRACIRAIASNFWNCSTSCIITSKLSRLCCISAHYKPLENLDAIALVLASFLLTESTL